MEISSSKKILSRIFFPIITIILLIPFFMTIIQSTRNFMPTKSLFEQATNNFEHYTRLSELNSFALATSNTLLGSVITLLFGSVYKKECHPERSVCGVEGS